jgi:sugar lactone lactonase YvrE
MVRPGGEPETFALPSDASDMPCGVVRDRDGSLIVSEPGADRIVRFLSDGSSVILVAGIRFPQALALDTDGNLYAVTGGERPWPDRLPIGGDAIIRISRTGQVTTLAHLHSIIALAISPTGELLATANQRVVRISLDGAKRPLCNGFTRAWGLAFDLAGMLYVSDMARCGIVRIDGFPYGTVAGVVKNQAGAPVEGARVTVVSDWPITVGQEVTTDAEGRFSLRAAPRTYTVTALAQDGTASAARDIRVASGQVLELGITLSQ